MTDLPGSHIQSIALWKRIELV